VNGVNDDRNGRHASHTVRWPQPPIRAADKVDFFDRMDVFNLLQNDFQIDDSTGEVVVIHPGTKLPRQNSSLKNMTVEEFISDFAKTKPHMVRSGNDGGGSGANSSKKTPDKKDEVVDYKTMPSKQFQELTQKVIASGYDRK
jgi:hypothetical protein